MGPFRRALRRSCNKFRTNAYQYFGLIGDDVTPNTLKVYGDYGNSYANIELSLNLVQAPPATTISSPANGAVVSTTTPTVTANPDGDPGSTYDFKISSKADGTGTITDSGVLYSPSWNLPAGALTDGATYFASVVTNQAGSGGALPAGPSVTFQVKQRLGGGGPSPTDTVGSPPGSTKTPSEGSPSPGTAPASVTVNMVTGNLALSAGTHALQTVAGPATVALDYNSSQPGTHGITGQYFAYNAAHDLSVAVPAGRRLDPSIDFNWGSDPPVAGLTTPGFLTRWTGTISLPNTGSWEFGGLTGGGMRVYVDQSTTASYDTWTGGSSPTSVTFGPRPSSQLTAGPHHIEVDVWNLTTPAVAQLWMKDTTNPDPTRQPTVLVTPDWFTPQPTGLPPGWQLSGATFNAAWSGVKDEGSSVIVNGANGTPAEFTRTPGGTLQAPPGDNDYLGVNGAGHLQLSTADNHLYVFNTDGSVASVSTIVDDRSPASLQYAYTGSPSVLTAITDPVSARAIQLHYGGDSACPTAPQVPAGLTPAPAGLLCQVNYWDNTVSTFFYSNGGLAQVTNPGQSAANFTYDSAGRLAGITDPLTNDVIATNRRAAGPDTQTQIAYLPGDPTNQVGRVASVTQPAPSQGAARPTRTYTYNPAAMTSQTAISGFTPSSGYASRVSYDTKGRVTAHTDSTGLRTSTAVWDNDDKPIVAVDETGKQTTTVYDPVGNVSDTYGPAPAACFDPITHQPVPNPQASPCSLPSTVPHTHHGYDEGLTGLAATYWPNSQYAGAAELHSTGLGAPQSSYCQAGTLCQVWSAPPVSKFDAYGNWSMRMTGTVNLNTTGTWQFNANTTQFLSVWIDNVLVANPAAYGDYGPPGTWTGGSVPTPLQLTAGAHQIRIEFTGSNSTLNGLQVEYGLVNGPFGTIPTGILKPAYGLQTSTVDPDGKTTTTSYTNATIGAEDSLATSTTRDPTGAALTTTTSYETPGAGYLRKTASVLPAGNATTYSYYAGTAGPLAAVCGVAATTAQGGQVKIQFDPGPAGSLARLQQFVYDAAGRVAGRRVGSGATINSSSWQCTTYDTRGRMTSEAWPAVNTTSARTVTDTYAVGGNPLTTTVNDSGTSPITPTSPGVSYQPVTEARVADTRPGSGKPYAGNTIGAGASLAVQITGTAGVPAGAKAAVVTVTEAGSTATAGFLSVYPTGTPVPVATSLNFSSGTVVSNQVTTMLSAAGQLSIYNLAGNTDVVVDVQGYYTTGADGFTPITPARVADTRNGSGEPQAGHTVGSGATVTIAVAQANNDTVPAGATAAVVEVTAVNEATAGFLVAYPAGQATPATANVNYQAGVTVTREVTVGLGTGGAITVLNNAASSTDVVADVVGYFTPTSGATYKPLSPARIADTRARSGQPYSGQTLPSGGTLNVQVAGQGGIPTTGVTAVILNVTEVADTANNFLTVYPAGQTKPNTTSLSFPLGVVVGNEVTTGVGANGQVAITNNYGNTDVVVDVEGYYTTNTATTPNPPTTVTSTVDLLGRVTTYTDATAQTTTTTYNQAGQTTTTTGPQGTITTTYDPNSGLPTATARDGTTLATDNYDSSGRLATVTYGNSTTGTLAYDNYGNQTGLNFTATTSGALIDGDQITKSPAGRTTTELLDTGGTGLINPNPAGGDDYTYDGAGRLTAANLPGSTATYSYATNPTSDGCIYPNQGANTNRTKVTTTPAGGPATTVDSCYNNADQLTSTITNTATANTAYSYDPHGNQTNDNGTILTWDSSDRLASTTTPTSAISTYNYDSLDRVVAQQDGAVTTRYAYSGFTTSPAATVNANGNVTASFVSLPGGITVTIPASGLTATVWSYPNLQGHNTLTASNTGTPQAAPVTYDPWGVPKPNSPPPNNTPAGGPGLGAYGAQGKLTDPNTGLITMGARPYNPTEARFLAVDPVKGGCANPYVYVSGDPLDTNDLSGQAGCRSGGSSTSIHCGLKYYVVPYCEADLSSATVQAVKSYLPLTALTVPTAAALLGILGVSGPVAGAIILGVIAEYADFTYHIVTAALAGDGLAISLTPLSIFPNYQYLKPEPCES